MRILLLGGTADGRELAAALGAAGVDLVTSVAGRTSRATGTRVGGFGGVDGLIDYLLTNQIDAVVDATHPFASTMTANAAQACAATGVPLLRFTRPSWADHRHSADWIWVPDHDAAAEVAARAPGRVLLSVGRQPLASYRGLDDALARVAEWQGGEVSPGTRILQARGPFSFDAELALLSDEKITILVSKDSGGVENSAKLDAAAQLGVPVVMIARPPLPAGLQEVSSIDDVLHWVEAAHR
ncbi:MAG: cobalt-precorrin-6A reductase [Propionibacterium sp.]|nr:cobalt-precorrin-6A reductase [Propionibacterium sp.]